MAVGDSATARKRVVNNRSTTQKRRKSKKNSPGLFNSVLQYFAQEAHSFVTNLSGVNESQQVNSEDESEEVRIFDFDISMLSFRFCCFRMNTLRTILTRQNSGRLAP